MSTRSLRSTPVDADRMIGHEKELQAVLRSLYKGNCCRILGPRHHQKSRLLRCVADRLSEAQTHFAVYIRLATLQHDEEEYFFAALWTQIMQQLPAKLREQDPNAPLSAAAFQRTLLAVSRTSERNLALLLDNLEIVPPNLAAALLGTLRAVFSTTSDQVGVCVQAVVCGSLHLSQVALDNASRFDSISDLVLISDLDEQARVEWARQRCRRAGLQPLQSGIAALLAETGGDPLLLDLLSNLYIEQMQAAQQTKLTPKRVAEALATFFQRPIPWQVSEALHQIESNPSLLTSTLLILEQGAVPAAMLPINSEELPTLLDLCGAFRLAGRTYQIRSHLWQTLLRHHLTPARVGVLYAIAGDWQRAIQHLGEAIHGGHGDVKPELFSAVINAIYDSVDLAHALRQLGQGLAAAYPAADAQLFLRTYGLLRQVYPLSAQHEPPALALSDHQWPEVEALNGPEYSILPTTTGTRLFFPLRIAPTTSALGLLSLVRLTTADSPYLQLEERMQLVNFLRQAARALESKEQFAAMLDTSNRRAEKLNTLNQILTGLLHQREQSEQRCLQIVLAAITNGWGLEFNRAILWLPDGTPPALYAALAVGHLTRAEAELEWRQAPYDQQQIEEWLTTLIQSEAFANPHHERLQSTLAAVHLPLTNGDDPLVTSFATHQPLHSKGYAHATRLDATLYQILQPPSEFALVPLHAGESTIGVIYVDNKFTGRPVSAEYYELLQSFVNQAALIIENTRAFAMEKAQTTALTKLLKLEERISNQITRSGEAVVQTIVSAANELVEADCTMIYPLRSTDLNQERREYDVEQITSVNVKNPLRNPPRRTGGHGAWVIQEGIVIVRDVATTVIPNTNTFLTASQFIREEGIQSFIGVRLGAQDAPVAVLYMNWRTLRNFTTEELQLIQLFANFAAVAIPSARRYQRVRSELERRTQELDRLRADLRAGLVVNDGAESESAFTWALHRAQERTGAAHVYLLRREPYDQQRPHTLFPQNDAPRVTPHVAEDAPSSSSAKSSLRIFRRTPNQPVIHLPFHYQDAQALLQLEIEVSGNSLATLYLEATEADAFPAEQQEYLHHIANRLALTLEQIERTQALRALVEIALALTRNEEGATMIETIVQKAMVALRTVSAITLYRLDEATDQLVLEYTDGLHDEDALARRPPYRHARLEIIWQLDDPIYAEDVRTHELFFGPFTQREKIQSAAAFPLQVNQARVGCMFFNYRTRHFFDEAERSLLALFAQLTAVAIHQARLEREVQYARERELWHRISELSTGLIHDVNSTLANILDLVGEIDHKLRAGKEVTAPLTDLRRLAEKTEDISARLYEHAYHKELRPEAIGLNTLLQQVLHELAHQKPPLLTVVYQPNEALPVVHVDRLLMIQLFRNLIINAWEAIPVTSCGTVTLEVYLTATHVQIAVRDTGCGIAPEHVDRIFEPTFTTKTTQPGLHGFGLYYCRQIVREHAGELRVQSVLGQGSTFTVELPLRIYIYQDH